jgi:hypothetical protein
MWSCAGNRDFDASRDGNNLATADTAARSFHDSGRYFDHRYATPGHYYDHNDHNDIAADVRI